jgi:NADH-quinone oxidoreductase subunit N
LQANLVGLTIIGVINSAVGAYYYLRIIVMMYMRDARDESPVIPASPALATALAISVAATLYLGILPGRILEFASRSAADLLR